MVAIDVRKLIAVFRSLSAARMRDLPSGCTTLAKANAFSLSDPLHLRQPSKIRLLMLILLSSSSMELPYLPAELLLELAVL